MQNKDVESTVRDIIRKMRASCVMNLKTAKALIELVEAEAKRMGVNVVIAVSDAGGHPIAVHCMDGAFLGSYDIAVNKTYTATAFQMPTSALATLAAPGGSLYGIQHTNNGKIVIFGGGAPLYVDGVMVGAIGVSGGTAQQDIELGVYGKEKLKDVIAWN